MLPENSALVLSLPSVSAPADMVKAPAPDSEPIDRLLSSMSTLAGASICRRPVPSALPEKACSSPPRLAVCFFGFDRAGARIQRECAAREKAEDADAERAMRRVIAERHAAALTT